MTTANAKSALPERLPEVGELVQVRSRRWLVEEVIQSTTPGQSATVRLACADDDAQGQSLDVFWDYELDRRILEEEGWAGLAARGFDAPRQFAAFLHTLQWNCVLSPLSDAVIAFKDSLTKVLAAGDHLRNAFAEGGGVQ